MDAKICDCCGKIVTDSYEARMHIFYINEEPECAPARNPLSNVFVKRQVKTPEIEIDLCGKCFDKLRGFASNGPEVDEHDI